MVIASTNKALFVVPERTFSRENKISWKVDQNFQTEFPNGKWTFHLPLFLVPGVLANWIACDPIHLFNCFVFYVNREIRWNGGHPFDVLTEFHQNVI